VEGGGGQQETVQAAGQEDLLKEGEHRLHQEWVPETASRSEKRAV